MSASLGEVGSDASGKASVGEEGAACAESETEDPSSKHMNRTRIHGYSLGGNII
jgi:hypothetical protein